ncbi:MAG: toxin-antitoxin system HicB family antitoxin [Waterburya sp.]
MSLKAKKLNVSLNAFIEQILNQSVSS